MSGLVELQILGVRAFDNLEFQRLKFRTPLTLICGANGVGKTTIIECLRYIATGDLPPNSKGGAFMHDPRISSKQSVKAQVKLVFRNAQGQMMQAARSMQLSYSSRGVPTFKTLDGYLTIQTGEPHSNVVNSARHADLNIQIPLALGVPPAILNFVVFCHQEDSLWPLSEPSVVKKRFDEIFEATRYSKALEVFKTDRKGKLLDIKVQRAKVEHLKEDMNRAKAREGQLKTSYNNLNTLKSDCERLHQDRIRVNAELQKSVENSQTLQQLKFQVSETEQRTVRLLQDIDILLGEIKEDLTGQPVAQLTEQLENSSDRESQLKQEESHFYFQKREIDNKMAINRDRLAVLTNKQGRIEQMMEAHAKRINERNALVGYNDSENDIATDIERWRYDRVAYLDTLKLEFERIELKNRQLEEELSQVVNSHEARRLQLREVVTSQRDLVRENEHSIADTLAKIASLSDPNSDKISLESLKARLENVEKSKSDSEVKYRQFEESDRLKMSELKVRDAEFLAEEAHKVVQYAIDKSATQSRLNFLRDSKQELDKIMEINLKKLHDSFCEEFPTYRATIDNNSRHQLDSLVRDKLLEQRNQLSDISDKITSLKSQYGFLKSSEQQIQNKIREINAERDDISANLLSENLGDDAELYETLVNNAQEALQSAIEDEEHLQFAHSYFLRGLEAASNPEHPVCQLCGHEKTPEDAKKFINRLKDTIQKLSISPEHAHEVTEQSRTKLESLRAIQPKVDQYRHLLLSRKALESESQQTNEKLAQLQTEINSLEGAYETENLRNTRCTNTIEPLLAKVLRNKDDLRDILDKIEFESAVVLPGDSQLSLQQAQEKYELAQAALKNAQSEFETVRSEQDQLKTEVFQLSTILKEYKLRISDFELKNSQKIQAEAQVLQLKKAQEQAQRKLDEAQASIPIVESEIDASNAKLRTIKHEHAQIERKFAESRNTAAEVLKQFDNLNSEIKKFEKEYGSEPLKELQQESQKIREELESANIELNEVNNQLKDNTKLQSEFNNYRRNLKDNLRIMKLRTDYKASTEELEVARQNLAEAQRSYNQDWDLVIRQLQEELGELNHSISTKSGESKAISSQIDEIKLELETVYKDTSQSYRDAEILLTTTEQAADDLVKYVNALDSAIMRYHSIKMAEINALLDVMWRQTYKGTDIDTILIKSESDSNSSSSRACYNYRVCMIKQDTELDMRGRCSAGQKVLASILIRMVLAECFGHKSGLIVLDEPTTNLDIKNSNALAESLNEIIGARRSKENFQLIVITHDENFLSQMKPADYCDDYYEVRRNKQQLSTIVNLPITSLK